MANNKLTMPSSQGGLVSYNDLPSNNKLQISPTMVTVFIGIVVIAEAVIKIVF